MARITGRRDVEILVHATAPSLGQDDTRYRALAQAYLDFEPVTTRRLEGEPQYTSEEDVNAQANSQLQDEFEYSISEERESDASYWPSDERETQIVAPSSISIRNKDLALDSPDLSFNSALDNADSPIWRDLHIVSQIIPNSLPQQRQISQTSAEIADSQPENNVTITAFSSPARILELFLQQVQSSGESSSASYGFGENGRQASGPSPELPSVIQCSGSRDSQITQNMQFLTSGTPSSPSPQKRLPKNDQRALKPSRSSANSNYKNVCVPSTQDPVIAVKRKWRESTISESHISSSAPTEISVQSSTVTTRTTRSRKRKRTDGSVDEFTSTDEVTSNKVIMIASSCPPIIGTASIWTDKMEIHPPPPQTSTKDLTVEMLLTPSLKQLAQKMPLGILFRSKTETRDLRPMERGHWILEYGNWDEGVQKRCWECLGNFIGRGLVGWGVWCIRDEGLNIIKVYCWGTIVGHVYLLLYLASESKIKTAGARWIGGDGEVIITMSE